MTGLVVDASAAAALVIVAQQTTASLALRDQWDRFEPFAPYVFALEMRWLLLRRERRLKVGGLLRSGLETLADLDIGLEPALERVALEAALAMAVERNMGFYDAMYVMLAAETGAALASKDARMVAVAERFGIEVLDLR